ncbi:MAG TPA: putative baseplate assembly protein [Thermoanaerobaculia bacterium]|nr:putative baseplate assembly protein [Thermoanaerobaculia bacterium]
MTKAQYRCKGSEARLQAVRNSVAFNGIEWLEVMPLPADPVRVAVIDIHFVKPQTGLGKSNFVIEGGERIRPIRILNDPGALSDDWAHLEVTNGDFSTYTLRLVNGPGDDSPPPFYDPQLSSVEFSFKVECPSDFDCKPGCACHPERAEAPDIDYLARDYATFRRLMLDRLTLLVPGWRERNPADIGITLVETLAYAADQLSYQQDAIATEAYLGTARRRMSVRRHARLVDYPMHDGCNARTWVQVRVENDLRKPPLRTTPILPASTQFITRTPELPRVIHPADLPSHLDGEVFESMHALDELYALHNTMPLYTWSATECCLPKGTTRATLAGHFPDLKAGHFVVFKEILGAETGEPVDADPTHVHAVRLTRANAFKTLGGKLTDPVPAPPVQITELEWDAADALPFPLCISAHFEAGDRNVSVVLGNIVLSDHGRSLRGGELLPAVPEPNPALAVVAESRRCAPAERKPSPLRYAPVLEKLPITNAAPADMNTAAAAVKWTMRSVMPHIEIFDDDGGRWLPRRDLLASDNLAREFVVEPDEDATRLRFGDDRHGRRPDAGMQLVAFYRFGNGREGNIGAEAIAHIAMVQPAGVATDIRTAIIEVTNPMPARGGVDPEPIEDVRQKAPVAFRTIERAVTERDYEEVVQRHAEVQRAAATIRWTGSWHTVYVTVDRAGGAPVKGTPFETELRSLLDRYRMAGVDVEVDGPRFVPLEIELLVCVRADYFRGDVQRAVLEVLGSRTLANGTQALFHPDRFTFGQPVYVSSIYAAVHGVTGVESVQIRKFQRQGVTSNEALTSGAIAIDRIEIARLDNDPSFPERGVVRLTMGGGR